MGPSSKEKNLENVGWGDRCHLSRPMKVSVCRPLETNVTELDRRTFMSGSPQFFSLTWQNSILFHLNRILNSSFADERIQVLNWIISTRTWTNHERLDLWIYQVMYTVKNKVTKKAIYQPWIGWLIDSFLVYITYGRKIQWMLTDLGIEFRVLSMKTKWFYFLTSRSGALRNRKFVIYNRQ